VLCRINAFIYLIMCSVYETFTDEMMQCEWKDDGSKCHVRSLGFFDIEFSL